MNEIHPNAHVHPDATIRSFTVIADGASISPGVKIDHNVFIGENVSIGRNTNIQGNCFIPSNVTISHDVFIGPGVTFCNVKRPPLLATSQKKKYAPTVVEHHAVIGAGATILPEVMILSRSKIGAGAVLTHHTNHLDGWYYGNPARFHSDTKTTPLPLQVSIIPLSQNETNLLIPPPVNERYAQIWNPTEFEWAKLHQGQIVQDTADHQRGTSLWEVLSIRSGALNQWHIREVST